MYLDHFGLSINPFSLSPKLDFLYQSETFAESMAHLVYGLDNQEAIVLVTGPIGTGKTMALQSFLSSLGPHYESALVTNTKVGSVELLKLMLEDLGVEFPPGVDKSDLLILFKNFLRESNRRGKTVLLIVDEAQNLEPEVLEELRLLTNLGQGDTQPVQIILVGQPELEDLVDRPDMAQIRQRIRVHYTLAPLNRKETEEYLAHRMRVAGCERTVFSKGAIDRIYQLSGGVPRVVNTHAGDALLSAFVVGNDVVKPSDVEDTGGKERSVDAVQPAPPVRPVIREPEVATPPTAHPEQPARPKKPAPTVMATRVERGQSRVLAVLVIVVVVAGLATGAVYFWDSIQGIISTRGQRTQTLVTKADAQPAGKPPVAQVEPKMAPVETLPAKPAVVATEAAPDAADSADKAAALPVAKRYYIHISSFRSADRAHNFAVKWKYAGGPLQVQAEAVNGVDWNRVYVGPFPSHDDALVEAHRLEREGAISYYAVKLLPVLGSG